MKTLVDITTDEQNLRTSDASDISDASIDLDENRAISSDLGDLISGHVKIVNKRGMYTI